MIFLFLHSRSLRCFMIIMLIEQEKGWSTHPNSMLIASCTNYFDQPNNHNPFGGYFSLNSLSILF